MTGGADSRVRDAMVSDPHALDAAATAQEAGEALMRPEVRSVLVCDAGDEWRLWPDDDEVCLQGPCQREQALAVLRPHRMATANAGQRSLKCVASIVSVASLLPGNRRRIALFPALPQAA